MGMLTNPLVTQIIDIALNEDVGTGDITTETTIPADKKAFGRFIAKENMIICGLEVAELVFHKVDETIKFSANCKDGDFIEKGFVIAEVSGNARNVLTGERTALNLMQRMTGVATRTNEAVKCVEGTNAKIADTRKTTPGLRVLEKYAVRVGGGSNHRFNLADGILYKKLGDMLHGIHIFQKPNAPRKHLDRIAAYYERAIELSPEFTEELSHSLITVYAGMGDAEKAEAAWARLPKRNYGKSWAHAEMQFLLKNNEAAVKEVKECVLRETIELITHMNFLKDVFLQNGDVFP